MRKKGKIKINHKFYEEKYEFGKPKSESLCFNWGIPIMLGPMKIFLISK
jgi:hypothetical protein